MYIRSLQFFSCVHIHILHRTHSLAFLFTVYLPIHSPHTPLSLHLSPTLTQYVCLCPPPPPSLPQHSSTLPHLMIHWSFSIIAVDKERMKLYLTHLQCLPDSIKVARRGRWRADDFKTSLEDGVV